MTTPTVVETPTKKKFTVGKKLFEGDLADFYASTYANGSGTTQVVLKIGRDRKDNDLLENEARILHFLYPATQKDEKFYRYLPRLIDTARLPDGRQVNVFPLMEGYVSMADVLAAYPKGIDFRDMVWMYKRLLSGLGFAHQMGIIHGAVLPTHVLVHPTSHGDKIIDWSYALNFAALIKHDPDPIPDPPAPVDPPDPDPYAAHDPDPYAALLVGRVDPPRSRAKKAPAAPPAPAPAPAPKGPRMDVWHMLRQNLFEDDDPSPVIAGDPAPPDDPKKMRVKAISVDYRTFYAPEILAKETPSPATDLFMAAKCAVALLGGDVETNQMPDAVPIQIKAFLQLSLLPSRQKRAHDAWELLEDFEKLLLQVVGPPKYRPFSLPAKGDPS